MSSIEHQFYRRCLDLLRHRHNVGPNDTTFMSDKVFFRLPTGRLMIDTSNNKMTVSIETSTNGYYTIFVRDNKTHRYPVCTAATVEQVMRLLDQELVLELLSDV